MPIKLALPKGRLLRETATLLEKAGWGLAGYHEGSRYYRPKSAKFPGLLIKVFHEKDIPIQVAVGNYDLGICGLDWVEELLARYPSSALVKIRELGYGQSSLYMAASHPGVIETTQRLIRIVSEYPNLAEAFALSQRLRRFSVFPVWGAAEVYPPENADLALVSVKTEAELRSQGLVPLGNLLSSSAFLVANRNSWESKDMGEVLASIHDNLAIGQEQSSYQEWSVSEGVKLAGVEEADDIVWLALPDGHQQLPTLRLLTKAGIQINDYPSPSGNRRPTANMAGVKIKTVRPQDMPLQVANGYFDLAITGKDWLTEHLYQFPSSPVAELLDLKFGKVKIVAVVSRDLPMGDISSLRQLSVEHQSPFTVASEYVNIADKYARDNHLSHYRVVPTWGATEAFLPEDADLLIENIETGRTLARHNLKVIDTLFESAACLIGNSRGIVSSGKDQRIRSIIDTLRTASGGGLNW